MWIPSFEDFTRVFPITDWSCELLTSLSITSKDRVLEEIKRDIEWAANNDPAASWSKEIVNNSYSSMAAVAAYRINRAYISQYQSLEISRAISHYVFNLTRIYISPIAKIGANFAIDHGFGTEIHSNVHVGDNVLILNEVKIGDSIGIQGEKVVVGSNVIVCANSVINQGALIDSGSFVKAFSKLSGQRVEE